MKKIYLNTVHKNSPHYKKYFALVDDEDFERINQHKWCVKKDYNAIYAMAWINGKSVLMHTLITGYKQTDHIDSYGLNNQKQNLRECTHRQNGMNRKPNKNTTSQYKGVYWFKAGKKWRAGIVINGKLIYLGLFLHEEKAAEAYNFVAQKYFGKFAKLNILKSNLSPKEN